MSALIINSFSMGETSAFMSKMLPAWYPGARIITVTANTGQESRESIQYGANVDRHLGLAAALVEAVVHPGRKGTTHRLVTWDTAYSGFDIWEAVIKKFGIFNIQYLHCTREMKERPIRSYLRSLGLRPRDYKIAVGIRADESERVKNRNPQFIYPLMDRGITREDVQAGVAEFPFKLGLPARAGNCRYCVKKSIRKLLINLGEMPADLSMLERIERLYGSVKQKIPEPRPFFREKKSAQQLRMILGVIGAPDPRLDNSEPETGCADQCLPFATGALPMTQTDLELCTQCGKKPVFNSTGVCQPCRRHPCVECGRVFEVKTVGKRRCARCEERRAAKVRRLGGEG